MLLLLEEKGKREKSDIMKRETSVVAVVLYSADRRGEGLQRGWLQRVS